MLGWLVEYEASFKFYERLEVKKLSKLLVHKVDGVVQYFAHMVHKKARHFVCEAGIATSSELDIGRIYFKYC